MTEPHVYIMDLKKRLKKLMGRKVSLIRYIYVEFDGKTLMPETIELHYQNEELEDEDSFKGSQLLHRVYNIPKTPLKFYKNIDAATEKLVLIYDNWTCKWHVNECELIEKTQAKRNLLFHK